MSRKLVDIKHHISDGCCMWSGIEDVYADRTGNELPEAFLFALSSYGETVYLKMPDKKKPYMFSVADGRTRETYDRIKDALGLEYRISEGRTAEYAMKSIKKEIDNGSPVILGPLDMYYLPYVKMYHRFHIPIHYVVMVGYDDEKQCALIYDCGKIELQELPYEELLNAWKIAKNPVGNKNGFIRFTLPDEPIEEYELADICFQKKAQRQLDAKPEFVGVTAFQKIAREFPLWETQMSQQQYRDALASLTEGFGMVPKLPNALMGIPNQEPDISYQGLYDRLGNVLIELGNKYTRLDWQEAGLLFEKCGLLIEEITTRIIRYLCHNEQCLGEIPNLFLRVGALAEQAYCILANRKDKV